MFRNPIFLSGFFIIFFIAFVCVFAPFITSYNPNAINLKEALLSPSSRHLLGTDTLGRDLLARLLYGGRVSLAVGFVAVGISVLIGVALGSIAGFYGGVIDEVVSRFIDIMLCFPSFFLILSLVALARHPSLYIIMAIIGFTSWMSPARLIRAEILSLRQRNFVIAALSCGLSQRRVIMRHIIPNAWGPVMVNATLSMAVAVLIESSLSFLGLGVQPPQASWGNILLEAKECLGVGWWMSVFPGLAIFFTVLGLNLIGEGIRESLHK